jgi:hypothetical protein
VLLIDLVLLGIQIAGVGIQRLEQPMQCSVADLRNVRIFHIIGPDARQHLAVNAELAICAIVAVSRFNADRARNREGED